MAPISINKNVPEPNYNDLKFMVWNRNCFCTNLIVKILDTGDRKFLHISLQAQWI